MKTITLILFLAFCTPACHPAFAGITFNMAGGESLNDIIIKLRKAYLRDDREQVLEMVKKVDVILELNKDEHPDQMKEISKRFEFFKANSMSNLNKEVLLSLDIFTDLIKFIPNAVVRISSERVEK